MKLTSKKNFIGGRSLRNLETNEFSHKAFSSAPVQQDRTTLSVVAKGTDFCSQIFRTSIISATFLQLLYTTISTKSALPRSPLGHIAKRTLLITLLLRAVVLPVIVQIRPQCYCALDPKVWPF